jgi:hypothetical protein
MSILTVSTFLIQTSWLQAKAYTKRFKAGAHLPHGVRFGHGVQREEGGAARPRGLAAADCEVRGAAAAPAAARSPAIACQRPGTC